MIIALILSGGVGSRLGAIVPKQYIEFNNRPIISWCIDTFKNIPSVDCYHIVADKKWHDYLNNLVLGEKFIGYSNPGETRQLSIMNGLFDIRKKLGNSIDQNCKIIIHDAARPFVTKNIVESIIQNLNNYEAVMPVLNVKDTIYQLDSNNSLTKLNRSLLVSGQAPEGFIFNKYMQACENLTNKELLEVNGRTEPAILAKLKIKCLPGDEHNFKITTKMDLERFKTYVGL